MGSGHPTSKGGDNMKTKEPKPITYNEVMSKLDELRRNPKIEKHFTPQMDALLLKARTGKKVVPFSEIMKLWEELGWGHIAHATLSVRLKTLQAKK
jgi:hypothetical protein